MTNNDHWNPMARKILISAVVIPDGIAYNQLVHVASDGNLSMRPVDSELSETRFVNGIMFSCHPESLASILSLLHDTPGGIPEKCTNLMIHHSPQLLHLTPSILHIYDLQTATLLN